MKLRHNCIGEAELKRALELERRAMRAFVTRLLKTEMPYERVKRLCYEVTGDVVCSGVTSPEAPGFDFLVGEALEHLQTLIDEMIERPARDG